MSSTSTKSRSTRASSKSAFKSRAVVRDVEAGSTVDCQFCQERVKFQAKIRNKQVICNVYVDGAWNRVEHYHLECYEAADSPYGEPEAGPDFRRAAREAANQSKPKIA